jgi:hypothetical protein
VKLQRRGNEFYQHAADNDGETVLLTKKPSKTSICRVLAEEFEPCLLFSADPTAVLALSRLLGSVSGAPTSQVRVANPTLLDVERSPTVTLRLKETDSDTLGLSDTANVTIQLNDLIGAAEKMIGRNNASSGCWIRSEPRTKNKSRESAQ